MNMTKPASELHSVRSERLRMDRRHFNVIFAFAFAIYLVAYGLARLLPRSWRASLCEDDGSTGIIQQARGKANLIASCATMA